MKLKGVWLLPSVFIWLSKAGQSVQDKKKKNTKTERVLMWIVLRHSTKNAVTKKYNEQVGKQNYDQVLKWHWLFKLK
jgi:hypothetical protein